MNLEQLKQLVTENAEYFRGVSPETPESIASAEDALGHPLPESMKWLLTNHGYSTACGLDGLDECVRLTLEHRWKIGLPARYIALNNWDDAGMVWMDTLAMDEDGEYPIFWSGAHNYLRLRSDSAEPMDTDVNRYAGYGDWVTERLQEARELEPVETGPDPDIMTGEPIVASDWMLGRVLCRVGLAVIALSVIVLIVQVGAALRWKSTSGVLQQAELGYEDKAGYVSSHGAHHQDLQWRYYSPSVSYTYSVAGKDYAGSNYSSEPIPAAEALGEKQTEELQKNVGHPIKVWYRRSQPEISALKLAYSFINFAGILAGGAFLLFGVALEQNSRMRRALAVFAAIACVGGIVACIVLWLGGNVIKV